MTEDLSVKALIELAIDRQQAEGIVSAVDKISKSIKAADENLKRLNETGKTFIKVGAAMAASGAALIAPFAAAASSYVERFGRLEKTSRAYLDAQQRQADATARLGRVSAEALAPIMGKIADFQEKIASFAEKNPNLVKAVVGGGAVLVGAGALLSTIGAASSAVAKGIEIAGPLLAKIGPALGGVVQAVGPAAVGIGAFAVGLKGGEAAVNLFGKVTGDSRLEHFKLADALKTVRQVIGIAILGLSQAFFKAREAFERGGDILRIVWEQVKAGITGFIDHLAVGLHILNKQMQSAAGEFLNGLLETVAKVAQQFDGKLAAQIRGGKDQNAIRDSRVDGQRGENQYDRDIRKLLAEIEERDKGRDADVEAAKAQARKNEEDRQKQAALDAEALGKFAEQVNHFVETGSLGELDKVFARAGELLSGGVNSIFGFVGGLANKVLGGPELSKVTPGKGPALPPEAVNAYIARNKAIVDSDRQYQVDLTAAKKNFNEDQAKAERQYQDDLRQLNDEARTADLEAEGKYQKDRARAQKQFLDNEAAIQRKADLEKEARAKQHELKLSELASEGDSDAFIAEQKSYALNEELQGKQDKLDQDQRQKDFNTQQEERDQQNAEERQQRQTDYDRRLKELNLQHDREGQERRTAYNQQLQDLETKHAQEKEAIDRNFAEQLANLSQNVAGLNAIQSTFYDQQLTEAQTFVDQYGGKLRKLYSDSLGIPDNSGGAGGAAGMLQSILTGLQSSIGSVVQNIIGAFFHPHANGVDVPYDNYLIAAHRGEKLLNAPAADSYRNLTNQRSVSLNIGTVKIGSSEEFAQFEEFTRNLMEAL